MRNSCKFARDNHAKLPAIAGKNTCNWQAKTQESQVKIPVKRRQKYPQMQAKIPSIAGKNTCNLQAKHPQSQAKIPAIAGKTPAVAGKLDCILQVTLPSTGLLY